MNTKLKLVSTLLLTGAVVLTGCKKKEADAAPDAVVVATPAAAPVAAPAPAPAVVETPAATAAAPAPAAAAAPGFDINSVPVTSTALPAFPYLDWPVKLEQSQRQSDQELDFDATDVFVGKEIRSVEGRVARRWYSLSDAKLSKLAAERNYEAALKAMGAVQVAALDFKDDNVRSSYPVIEDVSKMRKAFKVLDRGDYKNYLIRTPKGNVWISITIDDYNVNIVTVEEKGMEQSIKALSAAELQSELKAKGHVALYMNFDTDKAVILDKDKPTIAEVGRMLADDRALKLKVEGHTDSSGDAARNLRLSSERANAVVASLVSQGIDGKRLAALGLGGSKPVADNATEEGRAKNRRVELVKQG